MKGEASMQGETNTSIFSLLVFHQFHKTLREKWKVILVFAVIGAVLFGTYKLLFVGPKYKINAEAYIKTTDTIASVLSPQVDYNLLADCKRIFTGRTVLNQIIDDLELDLTYKELRRKVNVTIPSNTHVMEIEVKYDNEALGRYILEKIIMIGGKRLGITVGRGRVKVTRLPNAMTSEEFTKSGVKYVIMGAVTGAVIAFLYILFGFLNGLLRAGKDHAEDK